MTQISRRNFIKTGVAAATLAGMGPLPLLAERGKATDWVTLGRSGMKVTRLAFGTGTKGGSVQRALGSGSVYGAGASCIRQRDSVL